VAQAELLLCKEESLSSNSNPTGKKRVYKRISPGTFTGIILFSMCIAKLKQYKFTAVCRLVCYLQEESGLKMSQYRGTKN
jgi:hypothetical protein